MSLVKSLLAAAAALSLAGCASLAPPQARLPEEVRAALSQAGLPEQSLAVVAFPLSERGAGLRVQAERPMQPGSTMKLVTAAVALDRLGPGSTGRTELLAEGYRPGAAVLEGPLYLRGLGDDQLDWGALNTLLRRLREQGLAEIRGGLVVDRGLFRPARPDLGVPFFDEAPWAYYNVIPDALHLNGDLLSLLLESDGQQLRARFFPAWPGIAIDTSAFTLADRACKDWEQGWQIPELHQDKPGGPVTVRLLGSFPRHCRIEERFNMVDRQLVATQALRQMWRELGGSIAGEDREAATPAGALVLAQHQGRPLGELLRPVMKQSDNALTRSIYLRIGAAAAGPGEDSGAAAERVVREWFRARGIADAGMVLDNGSGLSRSERLSASQLAGLLAASQDGRHGPELLATLPVAGVDGTLRNQMKGTAAEARARMKTGTLRNVSGLAGYVPDSRGRLWVVAAFLNDERSNGTVRRKVLDVLIDWVARR